MSKIKNTNTSYRFIDEAGDTTFYGKGKISIIGSNGVSSAFILGMVKFREPLAEIRQKVIELQNQIQVDSYYKNVPSLQKKIVRGGFYFHATDDIAEVREKFFKFIKRLDCSFEAVVGRKIPALYEQSHNANETEFYADMLSHLLKKFQKEGKLILTIAKRGKSTRNSVLELAQQKAEHRFIRTREGREARAEIVFNIQNHNTEPLLNVADYFCWSIQRVFERGDTRYYEFLKEKIPVVIDLYNHEYQGRGNCYGSKNPLTPENKISPQLH
jgi:hypothetical protein